MTEITVHVPKGLAKLLFGADVESAAALANGCDVDGNAPPLGGGYAPSGGG